MANALSSSALLQKQAQNGRISVETLLCALCGAGVQICLEEMQVCVRSQYGEVSLFDYGKQTSVAQSVVAQIVDAQAVYIEVRLQDGHYKASAMVKLSEG
jgi:N-acetylglutamate synthase/N-acetylornithine aminotransferase